MKIDFSMKDKKIKVRSSDRNLHVLGQTKTFPSFDKRERALTSCKVDLLIYSSGGQESFLEWNRFPPTMLTTKQTQLQFPPPELHLSCVFNLDIYT